MPNRTGISSLLFGLHWFVSLHCVSFRFNYFDQTSTLNTQHRVTLRYCNVTIMTNDFQIKFLRVSSGLLTFDFRCGFSTHTVKNGSIWSIYMYTVHSTPMSRTSNEPFTAWLELKNIRFFFWFGICLYSARTQSYESNFSKNWCLKSLFCLANATNEQLAVNCFYGWQISISIM